MLDALRPHEQSASLGQETTKPGSGIGTTDVMLNLDFPEDFLGWVTVQLVVIEMKLTGRVVIRVDGIANTDTFKRYPR